MKAAGWRRSTTTSNSARGPSMGLWNAEDIVLLRMALSACRWALRTGVTCRSRLRACSGADSGEGGPLALLHGSVVLVSRKAPKSERYTCVCPISVGIGHFGHCERVVCGPCDSRWWCIDSSVQYDSRANGLELTIMRCQQHISITMSKSVLDRMSVRIDRYHLPVHSRGLEASL